MSSVPFADGLLGVSTNYTDCMNVCLRRGVALRGEWKSVNREWGISLFTGFDSRLRPIGAIPFQSFLSCHPCHSWIVYLGLSTNYTNCTNVCFRRGIAPREEWKIGES